MNPELLLFVKGIKKHVQHIKKQTTISSVTQHGV